MKLARWLNQVKSALSFFLPWLFTTGFSGLLIVLALKLVSNKSGLDMVETSTLGVPELGLACVTMSSEFLHVDME